jgi:uncharacterized membrane-anchored protein YjiN (DUF445 family)
MPKLVVYLNDELAEKIKQLAEQNTNGNISKMTAKLLEVGMETLDSEDFQALYKKMVLVQLQTLEYSKKIFKCVNEIHLSGFEDSEDFNSVVSEKSRTVAKELLADREDYF